MPNPSKPQASATVYVQSPAQLIHIDLLKDEIAGLREAEHDHLARLSAAERALEEERARHAAEAQSLRDKLEALTLSVRASTASHEQERAMEQESMAAIYRQIAAATQVIASLKEPLWLKQS